MNQILQRFCSVLLYTFPLKTSLPFGYYLFYKFSYLKYLLLLTLPFSILENSLPLGSFLLFFLIFLGLVRNSKVPYFLRYNACQALLLNIGLIIVNYFLNIFPLPFIASITFILSIIIFIFVSIQCIYGIEPELPLISRSVRMQMF